jgi:YidC/Oxa1 family membrane protein insertase
MPWSRDTSSADIHQTPVAEPKVTTATPELAPAGIDQPAVVDTVTSSASQPGHGSIEELVDNLLRDPPEVVQDTVVDPHTVVDHFGALKEMGLDYGIGPTALFEWLIEHVYIWSGLGWGMSILACVTIIRTGMFWVNMKSSDNMAKMASVSPLIKDIDSRMRESIKNNDTAKTQMLRAEMKKIYKDTGVNPLASFPPLAIQMAMGFGAWRCVTGMAALPVPGLSESGWLWFQNLTIPDPYYVFPAAAAGLTYGLLKVSSQFSIAIEISKSYTDLYLSSVVRRAQPTKPSFLALRRPCRSYCLASCLPSASTSPPVCRFTCSPPASSVPPPP